jgi:methylenetetrahydrofolate reductase (NADPH)
MRVNTKNSIYKKDLNMSKHIPISFEFFPTKTDAGAEKLKVVHQELQLLNPEFFSITYGAGGSTRERTLAAIAEFNGKGTPVAPHLSCIGDDKARIAELLDIYKDQGINRIVALRGDLPSGQVGLAATTISPGRSLSTHLENDCPPKSRPNRTC